MIEATNKGVSWSKNGKFLSWLLVIHGEAIEAVDEIEEPLIGVGFLACESEGVEALDEVEPLFGRSDHGGRSEVAEKGLQALKPAAWRGADTH